jgi:hypothetical protein
VREFGVVDPEVPVESWTAGLRQKGEVSFSPGREQDADAPSISCLLVEPGDEAAGLGMAYAATYSEPLHCSYLPTDKDESINFGSTADMRASNLSALRGEQIQGDISSVAYHPGSHTIIVTSTASRGLDVESRGRIDLFQPSRTASFSEDVWASYFFRFGGRRPTWLLGETDAYLSYTSPVRGLTMHMVRASASSSGGPGALIATSHGIMGFESGREGPYWVTPKPTEAQQRSFRRNQGDDSHRRPPLHDVFAVDYSHSDTRVCYAGCRDSRVCRIDTRVSPAEGAWDSFSHRSSAAHVRCIDDHRILVAGPRSAMAIYDTRWVGPTRSSSSSGARHDNRDKNRTAQAVVQFPEYRNVAHIRIGLDVTHDAGGPDGHGGGGIVAAGMGDGTVGIFSLRTGRKLRAGDVDNPQILKAPGPASGGVVKALQFRRFPWEKEASLFVGVGPILKKFTFGLEDGEDAW